MEKNAKILRTTSDLSFSIPAHILKRIGPYHLFAVIKDMKCNVN
jgi:hypothetical protein